MKSSSQNNKNHPRGFTPPSGVGGLAIPNFLIVGAQKCGTTSLHELLSEHPQIEMSQVKEINFFSIQSKFEKGLSYYCKFFKKDTNSIAIGESSPGYLCYPEVHEKIYQTLGQIKIVIILRDPIKRAFSQYWDNRRQLKECHTEKEIIEKYLEPKYSPERKGYFSRGVYYNDVKKYIDKFGDEHVHILILEELIKYPKAELQRLYSFLKVDKTQGHQKLARASNRALVWDNPFYKYFLNHPKQTKYIPGKMRRLLFFGKQHPWDYELPNQVYIETLKSFYNPWNKKLEDLLGIKLKYWT